MRQYTSKTWRCKKVTKSIVAGIIALALVVSCGIVEVVVLRNRYEELHAQCLEVMELAREEKLSAHEFDAFRDKWVELRETSELFLPHQDVYEMNLRFAESEAYVEQNDYEQLLAQLSVIEELLQYVPHLMTPNFNHLI